MFVTLEKGCGLAVFENRKISKLHNEWPYGSYSSQNFRMIKWRRMRWLVDVVHIVQVRVLMGKSEGKGPPGRYRCRYEDNIKIDIYNPTRYTTFYE